MHSHEEIEISPAPTNDLDIPRGSAQNKQLSFQLNLLVHQPDSKYSIPSLSLALNFNHLPHNKITKPSNAFVLMSTINHIALNIFRTMQKPAKMKDDHHHHHVNYRRRRTCTVAAVMAAIAYTLGVITSPLVSSHDGAGKAARPVNKPVTPLLLLQQNQISSQNQMFSQNQILSHNQISSQTAELTQFDAQCAEPVPSNDIRRTLIDGLFNGTSPFDGFPPEHVKPFLRTKRVKGWGSTGAVFERLIKEVKPRTVVELGTFLGASAIHMARVAYDQGLNMQILCIDDFRGWPGFRQKFKDVGLVNGDVTLLYQFMQNVKHMNLTAVVLPLPFSTVSMARKLCELGVYADLVEIDAAHDFLSAWADINTAYALLRPGGVMFGHDYHTKLDNCGVRRAVNLFARVRGLTVERDGEHWILRPSGDGS